MKTKATKIKQDLKIRKLYDHINKPIYMDLNNYSFIIEALESIEFPNYKDYGLKYSIHSVDYIIGNTPNCIILLYDKDDHRLSYTYFRNMIIENNINLKVFKQDFEKIRQYIRLLTI